MKPIIRNRIWFRSPSLVPNPALVSTRWRGCGCGGPGRLEAMASSLKPYFVASANFAFYFGGGDVDGLSDRGSLSPSDKQRGWGSK